MSKATANRQGARLNIEGVKGDTFYLPIHCEYYDSGNTKQDFSWSNYSGASMQVKRKTSSSVIELTFTTDDGTIELALDGRLRLSQSAEVMDTVRAGEYEYDLVLFGTDSHYNVRDFIYGKFTVAPKITT